LSQPELQFKHFPSFKYLVGTHPGTHLVADNKYPSTHAEQDSISAAVHAEQAELQLSQDLEVELANNPVGQVSTH